MRSLSLSLPSPRSSHGVSDVLLVGGGYGTIPAQYAGTRRELLKGEMRFAALKVVGRLAGYLTPYFACYLTILAIIP